MVNFTTINGENIKLEYLEHILELDKKVYPEKYWTNIEFMKKWFLKNPNIITLLYNGEELAGYFSYLPISDESYFEIRKGEVFQDLTIPCKNLREYKSGEEYNLYIFSIVLNPKYHGSNGLNYLLKGFYDTTSNLVKKGVNFKSILGDVVSNKGEKLAKTLGFTKLYNTQYDSIMYEGKYNEFLVNYKKNFVKRF